MNEYTDITAIAVFYNEGHRMIPLLERLRPHFRSLVIGVQDSTDSTLMIAREYADKVVEDRHHGYGDPTLPTVLANVHTKWTFKIDGDELPTEDLLASLGDAVTIAELENHNGVWVRFRSWIDNIEWESYHSHLRLFETQLGWPGTLHSRPMTSNTMPWEIGWIEHRKSLDEHVQGYLAYLRIGRGHASWDTHNASMIWHACVGTAQAKGWEYIKTFEWWPEVQAAVFQEGVPELVAPEL